MNLELDVSRCTDTYAGIFASVPPYVRRPDMSDLEDYLYTFRLGDREWRVRSTWQSYYYCQKAGEPIDVLRALDRYHGGRVGHIIGEIGVMMVMA